MLFRKVVTISQRMTGTKLFSVMLIMWKLGKVWKVFAKKALQNQLAFQTLTRGKLKEFFQLQQLNPLQTR